jgi:aryl-alcohol dehydrogenase-like predicted oxidoreductase
MEQIAIGASGLNTSRIGLGTWAIGGWMWGGTDEAQSIATIRSAVERGVTLIDTAPAYGFGRFEEIVGKALAEGGLRDKVQIATKVGLAWKDGAVFRDSRPARIRREIEDSLRRLRTNVIDLYQVHWPDLETPFAQTARTLEDLRREGKIRAIGVSNYAPAHGCLPRRGQARCRTAALQRVRARDRGGRAAVRQTHRPYRRELRRPMPRSPQRENGHGH